MVELKEVTVRFRRASHAALAGVSLTVAAGEQVLVMGPSGCGKSTLLRLISGVVPHSVSAEVIGQVQIAGTDIGDLQVADRTRWCGSLAQDPATSLCLSRVDDEVAFPLENRALPREAISAGTRSALQRVGAGHLANRATQELSGGEQQRVALAATLAAEPDVVLLDEPSALLDPAAAAQVGTLIGSLGREGRAPPTVLLVEHRLDELAESGGLPHRTVALNSRGELFADGTTDSVLRDYGAQLAAEGAWLPLDVELQLATGVIDPLGSPHLDASLGNLVRIASTDRPMTEGPVLLRASALSVCRGQRQVLRGVDLELRAGEVTAILGENGSGKTSLLLAMAGLLDRDEVGGAVDRSDDGGVGMVFQRPEYQFVARTVADDVAHGATPERAARCLRLFDLEQLRDRDPYRLSGGQQRRLSLAAMAALDHQVLLADEPTFGLDRRHAFDVVDVLRDLAGEGRAVALTTHDLRAACLLADHLIVMSAGTVVAAGPTEQVLRSGVLAEAGIPLPRLLAWWSTTDLPVRALLTGLRRALERVRR